MIALLNYLIFYTIVSFNAVNARITAHYPAPTTAYAQPIFNRDSSKIALEITTDAIRYFTQVEIDSSVVKLDSTFHSYQSDSAYNSRRANFIRSLKSQAYSALQGTTPSTTLSASQLQIVAKIVLWDAGAYNPITTKVDSLLGFIK